ncbi:Hypothetical protein, putative [Bodo saltans]|uniref:Uncharacterized protein n=1 Tax=Bodo saltans TaxID=75058 RepID=A0A0S4JL35_BODSA|nr:Hypothetical protein, putative [Bodo saltans]|eukprot:CUG89181.1 Hypothetical protein, putative [Bodo saltans]
MKKPRNCTNKAKTYDDPCDESLRRFEKLWEKTGGAWIEISSRGLASADIVLHIPKIVTLPIQCKDRAGTFEAEDISDALSSMLCSDKRPVDAKLEPKNLTPMPHARDLLTQKLVDLGAPVIPVMYVSHASTLTDSTSMCSAKFDVIDPHCIMAEGIGEPGIPKDKLIPYLARDNENNEGRRLADRGSIAPDSAIDDVVRLQANDATELRRCGHRSAGACDKRANQGPLQEKSFTTRRRGFSTTASGHDRRAMRKSTNMMPLKKRNKDDAKMRTNRINLLDQFRSID